MAKNIEMQVLGLNGEYNAFKPIPAKHAFSHGKNGSDPITPESIGVAPAYSYSAEDLTEGTFKLKTGNLYFVYEL